MCIYFRWLHGRRMVACEWFFTKLRPPGSHVINLTTYCTVMYCLVWKYLWCFKGTVCNVLHLIPDKICLTWLSLGGKREKWESKQKRNYSYCFRMFFGWKYKYKSRIFFLKHRRRSKFGIKNNSSTITVKI